jgi:hypothetical protein
MPFIKGKSGNPKGRPRGTKSKLSRETRELIHDIVQKGLIQIEDDLKQLSPSNRVKVLVDLLPYDIPRLQNTTLKTDIESLTDEQKELIVNELLQKLQ